MPFIPNKPKQKSGFIPNRTSQKSGFIPLARKTEAKEAAPVEPAQPAPALTRSPARTRQPEPALTKVQEPEQVNLASLLGEDFPSDPSARRPGEVIAPPEEFVNAVGEFIRSRQPELAPDVRPESLFGIIGAESEFDPFAISGTGPGGLGQLAESTARSMGISPEDRFVPETALETILKLRQQETEAFERAGIEPDLRAQAAGQILGQTQAIKFLKGEFQPPPEKMRQIEGLIDRAQRFELKASEQAAQQNPAEAAAIRQAADVDFVPNEPGKLPEEKPSVPNFIARQANIGLSEDARKALAEAPAGVSREEVMQQLALERAGREAQEALESGQPMSLARRQQLAAQAQSSELAQQSRDERLEQILHRVSDAGFEGPEFDRLKALLTPFRIGEIPAQAIFGLAANVEDPFHRALEQAKVAGPEAIGLADVLRQNKELDEFFTQNPELAQAINIASFAATDPFAIAGGIGAIRRLRDSRVANTLGRRIKMFSPDISERPMVVAVRNKNTGEITTGLNHADAVSKATGRDFTEVASQYDELAENFDLKGFYDTATGDYLLNMGEAMQRAEKLEDLFDEARRANPKVLIKKTPEAQSYSPTQPNYDPNLNKQYAESRIKIIESMGKLSADAPFDARLLNVRRTAKSASDELLDQLLAFHAGEDIAEGAAVASVKGRRGREIVNEWLSEFEDELRPLITGRKIEGRKDLKKGFEGFMRLYLTDSDAAISLAPNLFTKFDEALKDFDPLMRESMLGFRRVWELNESLPAAEKVGAKIRYTGETAEKTRTLGQGIEGLRTRTLDQLNPIRVVNDILRGNGKATLRGSSYVLARNFANVNSRVNLVLENATYSFRDPTRLTGPGLYKIIEPHSRELDDLDKFLASKAALRLSERGVRKGVGEIEPGIPIKEAREIVEAWGSRFEGAEKEVRNYLDRMLLFARDAGLITSKEAAKMKLANRDYVPFYRVFGDLEDKWLRSGAKKFVNVKKPFERIRGSEREILSPIEGIQKYTENIILAAERNRVGRAFRDEMVQLGGEGVFAVKIGEDAGPTAVQLAETRRLLKENGLKFDDEEVRLFTKLFRPEGPHDPRDKIVSISVDGKREWWRIPDDDLYAAINRMGRDELSSFVKIMGLPAKILKTGVVRNPAFIFRNFIRDQTTAFIQTETGYIPFYNFVEGFASFLKRDESYQRWVASGGDLSSIATARRSTIRGSLKQIVEEEGASALKRVVLTPRDAWRAYTEFADAIENATRLAEFKRAIAQGVDPFRAGFLSREVSVDFARIGSQMQSWNHVSAFLNPAIQGMAKTISTFHTNPVRAATATSILTSISFYNFIANRNDPDWQEQSDTIKNVYWLFKIPGTREFWRVPKPFEYAIIPSSIERFLEFLEEEEPGTIDEMMVEFGRNFAENIQQGLIDPTAAVPTAMRAPLENWANRSMFFGTPIISEFEKNLEPELQMDENTDRLIKAVTDRVSKLPQGVKDSLPELLRSPKQLQAFIRSSAGGLANNVIDLLSSSLQAMGLLEQDPTKAATILDDIPFLSDFISKSSGFTAQSVFDFYEDSERARKAKRSFELIKEKDPKGAQEYRKQRKLDLSLHGPAEIVRRQMANIRRKAEQIRGAEQLDEETKKDRLDQLSMQMLKLGQRWREQRKKIEEQVSKE